MTVDQMPRQADVVVIGAGVTGLCASLFLSKRGRDVVLFDRGMPWGEASGVNAGTLTVQGEYAETIPLTRLSVDLWEKFGAEWGIDVGFRRSGGLRVATTDAEVAALQTATEERRAKCGLYLEWLEGNALRVRAPWLGPNVKVAAYCAEDAFSSPLVAGVSLLSAAKGAGVRIVANTPVLAIISENEGFLVKTPHGPVHAASIIVTAGPWSGELVRMLGTELPAYVDIDMLSVTETCPPLLDCILTHAAGILSLKQFPNGSIVIGGGWQGRGRFAANEKKLDYARLLQNLAVAAEVVPGLAELRIVRSWAGYEGVASDGMPVIGRIPSAPNAYIAAITRGGYTHGPAMALLITEMMLEGKTQIPIEHYAPERLTRRH